MKINSTKIQAEAQQIEEQKKLEAEQSTKLKSLLEKHEANLKKLFTDSLADGSVSTGNGGRELTAKFGEVEISMYLSSMREGPKGTLVSSPTIDPFISKKISGTKIFSIQLADVTNYQVLEETSTNYEYRYKLNEQVQQCSYADIFKIIQMVADS